MIVIHHNPNCSTSRKVLAMIRDAGVEPVVVEYLKTGWTRTQLQGLFAAADLTPHQALRVKGNAAAVAGLIDAADDDAILDAMVEHPILVERPIVCAPAGVRLCRPAELVQDLLSPR